MGEPEELLVHAALYATSAARAIWRNRSQGPTGQDLAALHNRLELYLAALFGQEIPILGSEPPAAPTWLGRLTASRSAWRAAAIADAPSNDGRRIRLPSASMASRGDAKDGALLRLLAVEQAARIVRRSAWFLPDEASAADLFYIGEAAVVDAWIAGELPGLRDTLMAARAAALERRRPFDRLSSREQTVENILHAELRSPPGQGPLRASTSPAAVRAWAAERSAALAAPPGKYRPMPPVYPWGAIEGAGLEIKVDVELDAGDRQASFQRPRSASLATSPRARRAEGEDDAALGAFVVKANDAELSVEDPMGLVRPVDRDQKADPDELASSLSDLAEARLVSTPGVARELLVADHAMLGRARVRRADGPGSGLVYPEWDFSRCAYVIEAATVHPHIAEPGDAGWAQGALARHRALVRNVRRRFERLRVDRIRIGREADGPDIDIEAVVSDFADRRAGRPTDDRIYATARVRRRDLAICILIDVSASTDAWVSGKLRVVDVEKEALLVVCEALEQFGDRCAILGFSGEGRGNVSLFELKRFDEPFGESIKRRIAGLQPDRYTRAGAALRHATALLCRQPARQRLLLLLSDGKPNDVDRYEGRYGIEDVRQAVAEARMQSLCVFCLTVDRKAPAYAARLFGPGGFAVLHHPERLPGILVDVLKRFITR